MKALSLLAASVVADVEEVAAEACRAVECLEVAAFRVVEVSAAVVARSAAVAADPVVFRVLNRRVVSRPDRSPSREASAGVDQPKDCAAGRLQSAVHAVP